MDGKAVRRWHTTSAMPASSMSAGALGALLFLAMPAAAGDGASVRDWTVTRVNQERTRVGDGRSTPLCQAIPATVITVHLRHRGPARSVVVRLRPPGREPRPRRIRLPAGAGVRDVAFTPRSERLPGDAFAEGTHRLTVRRAGHLVAQGSLRMAGGGIC
jgi:hypothetical protein